MRLELVCVVLLMLTLGCGRLGFFPVGARLEPKDDSGSADGGRDAVDSGGTPDTGSIDVNEPDANAMDAALPDSGFADGAVADGDVIDAAAIDGSAGDSAVTDGGAIDAAAIDDGTNDAEVMDGSVMDGSADTGVVDSGVVDSGPSPLCPEQPGVLFCDGFEDPAFSRWSFMVLMNGTLTRSTTHVHGGATALRATTGAVSTGNAARYATKVLAGQKSGDIWTRYYYYLPSSTVINANFSAGVMGEISPPYDGFFLVVRASRVDIGGMGGPYTGTLSFPRDKWTCVELHAKVDPTQGFFEAYLDGALAVRSPTTNTVPADGYGTAEFGVHYAEDGTQGPVEVYVDDVAVSTARVPCN